jgi:hypothetical protein
LGARWKVMVKKATKQADTSYRFLANRPNC